MGDGTGQALKPVEQDTIMFYGHELVAVRLADGRIAAVLRWLFESLNLERRGQMQRIERKTALRKGLIDVDVDTPGGPQTMSALTLQVLPGYLFTIDENRVNEEARADVIPFQEECVEALAEHFTRKHQAQASQALTPAEATASAAIIAQIADLTGVVNLLREHLEALLVLPGQVADLSTRVGETRALVESLAERQGATETLAAQVARIEARTQRLTPAHARAVQERVDRIVRATQQLPQPLSYAMVYGRLKHTWRANSYSEIPDERFEEVMAYLREELRQATGGETPEQGSLF
jgi:hypothetical protein